MRRGDHLILVNCAEDECPVPFVKTRDALLKSQKGDLIKVIGKDKRSYYEILMALEVWDAEVVKKEYIKDQWEIVFKVLKN